MYRFPIGAMVESFRLPFDEVITKAAELGVTGLQLHATRGEFAAENLDAASRREILKKAKDRGLCFSALCGDLGRGFGNPELNPELIERSKRIVELAKDLETDIITTHIGVVPSDPKHPRYQIMSDACFELSRFADSMDAHFAVETGPEPGYVLKGFLDQLGSRGVAVNFDPANLAMVVGDDPVDAVHQLKDYIVHTHAKDGMMLERGNPEQIYGVTPMPEDLKGIRFFREVPLGMGSVVFPDYLKALEEVGYRGYLTIEREVGDDPVGDIGIAVNFLKKTMEG